MGSKRQKKEHPSSAGNTAGVSKSQPPVHEGVQCDNCGLCPIVGPRYKSEVQSLSAHISIRENLCPLADYWRLFLSRVSWTL